MSLVEHGHATSLSEVNQTVDTTQPRKGFKRVLAYLGPAYLVSVGYMDPGNWATDLQGGAKFGYQLIWVLLMSNLMALLLQSLSARLGIVRRQDLAQANRATYPPIVNFCLYILAELAIAATDLAEVVGMAIGIHLLTGLPLLGGVSITVLDTFLLLWLQQLGIRKLEAFIIALVAVIACSFAIEIFFAKPDFSQVVKGFVPTELSKEALYIAVGIIGATVMPHNLYLHSALVQTRKIATNVEGIKRALKYNFIDSAIALNAAFFVNAAILILAASAFYFTGNTQVAKIEDAHTLLAPLLGNKMAPIIFAVALIAAGQSSTVTGTLAGQIVMEGYLSLRINPILRRLITRLLAIVPAIFVIIIYGEEKVDDLLVFSQVILSLQLGFAIIPLIHFVSDKQTMGSFAIGMYTKIAAWIIAIILIGLNVKLVANEVVEVFSENGNMWVQILVVVLLIAFAWLFVSMTIIPLQKKQKSKLPYIHPTQKLLSNLKANPIQKIAIALDFSNHDETVIARAIQQGAPGATYVLIHVIESVNANYLGKASDDIETRIDKQQLESYAQQLKDKGFNAIAVIGYTNRVVEIVKLVQEHSADMLVMGAHKHSGLKDYLFGETIDAVRHAVKIPVLIVN